LITFALAALVLSIIDWRYGQGLFWSLIFLVYLVKEIIVSNIALAWLIIQPKPKVDPGIIAIPLTVTTGLEVTILSLAIAVTPGTMVVELGRDQNGRYELYVHAINVGDPGQFRASIKEGFERMILRVSRGATT
jgi:multicomponent Na+:H+ antiporter subunit E